MLDQVDVQPMLPVKDLGAARKFYEDVLGFEKVNFQPDVVVTYRSGSGKLSVYRSEFAGTNKGTAAVWEVDDVDGTVRELSAKGVTFEHYDNLPHVTRVGDVYVAGPVRVAWFKDPSGNILSIQSSPAGARQ